MWAFTHWWRHKTLALINKELFFMSHFPNHPKDQTEFSFREVWDEYWRLERKWFKTRADKWAIKVLNEAMTGLVTRDIKPLP